MAPPPSVFPKAVQLLPARLSATAEVLPKMVQLFPWLGRRGYGAGLICWVLHRQMFSLESKSRGFQASIEFALDSHGRAMANLPAINLHLNSLQHKFSLCLFDLDLKLIFKANDLAGSYFNFTISLISLSFV